MAKSKRNENCPFKNECERICTHLVRQEECDYYIANYIPEEFRNPKWKQDIELTEQKLKDQREIVYIPISKLHPHPNNPRKDLGDLTELADSIKRNGVLQNLTVVPHGERGTEYTVIIGHRRRAAAKKAGLTELPCIICEMSEKEQKYTMLIENMQRTDLTIPEQSYGIQEMLDFGESVEDISSATGLSQTTVRRRAKIARYDKDKVQDSFDRGATIFDYEKLEKIKDPELRERVLDSIGTNNFESDLKKAMQEETRAAIIVEVEKFLNSFAIPIQGEVSTASGKKYIKYFGTTSMPDLIYPEDRESIKYYYTNTSVGNYYLYRDKTKEELAEDKKDDKERIAHNEKRAKYQEVAQRAYELRYDFVKGLLVPMAKIELLLDFVFRSILERENRYYNTVQNEKFCELLGKQYDGRISYIVDENDIDIRKALLYAAYLNFDDRGNECYISYNDFAYTKNEKLDIIYDFLISLGYQMSDEEAAWREGTLEL